MLTRRVRIASTTVLLVQATVAAQAGAWEDCKSGDVDSVVLACSAIIDGIPTWG